MTNKKIYSLISIQKKNMKYGLCLTCKSYTRPLLIEPGVSQTKFTKKCDCETPNELYSLYEYNEYVKKHIKDKKKYN